MADLADLIEELKKEVRQRDYEALTDGGDDSIAERALSNARNWLKAKLRTYGIAVDLENEIVKQALLKRALYELYSRTENEDIARDKAKDAVELLRSEFGKSIEGEGEKTKGDPVAYVQEGSDSWRGF